MHHDGEVIFESGANIEHFVRREDNGHFTSIGNMSHRVVKRAAYHATGTRRRAPLEFPSPLSL
jgi:hypothetical protein